MCQFSYFVICNKKSLFSLPHPQTHQNQTIHQLQANAEWFHTKPKVQEKITVTVFMVTGETNTDDLSPAPDAFTRPDIPLHANAMLKLKRDGIGSYS